MSDPMLLGTPGHLETRGTTRVRVHQSKTGYAAFGAQRHVFGPFIPPMFDRCRSAWEIPDQLI